MIDYYAYQLVMACDQKQENHRNLLNAVRGSKGRKRDIQRRIR
jgi:hypothetical protein